MYISIHDIPAIHVPFLFESEKIDFLTHMSFKANKNKLEDLVIRHRNDTDKDCCAFMNFLRKEVTGDEFNYISGNSES
jgi:hypothetical protein